MNKYKKNNKADFKTQIIKRQSNEIQSLKDMIAELEINSREKEEMLKQVDITFKDLQKEINELRQTKKRYEKLITELWDMREAMNQTVFNGRWKLIRFLLK